MVLPVRGLGKTMPGAGLPDQVVQQLGFLSSF
jgi:hypothetical protein